jgi:hypothetical protein
MADKPETTTSGSGVLARLYWFFIGNALVFFLLVTIVEKRVKLPSLYDAAYLAALASLIAVRHYDIRFCSGETAMGQPAMMAHWRRYAVTVGVAGVGAWLLAHVLVHLLK